MADYRRLQVATIVERLNEPPERLLAIFGPRQSGKTWAVRQALASIPQRSRIVPVDAPDEDVESNPIGFSNAAGTTGGYVRLATASRDVQWLVDIWEEARYQARSSDRGFVLALDEIQRVQGWAAAVKGLWDADRASGCPLHVVMLGSAPLLMQAGLNESLMGRFEPIDFVHWSFDEMADAFEFDLDEYVYFGGYPGAASFVSDHQRWHRYVRSSLVEPSIERDVIDMTRVDKPELLRQVFDVAARHSGRMLSYTQMLGLLEDAGNTTTVTRYLDLLHQVGLVTGLPAYSESAVSRASSPKLNVLNTGLMSMASGYTFHQARVDRTLWHYLVESAVGAHLLNSSSPGTNVAYWRGRRRRSVVEVSFVVERGPHRVGIDVASEAEHEALPGLDEFADRFDARTLVVGEGGVPLDEFLSASASEWIEEA
ncbi:MAG: AAA family ATPase [Acidimicrobiaceae bacterium]|nr:AAA family ATPase [Acidimicrobiaceae bacterium]